MTTYHLLADESIGEGVARIISDLAEGAQQLLINPNPDEAADAVHEARKLCKKARGLVRLVRPALGDHYHFTNRMFRDAARELAPIRDPQAMLCTFDTLVAADAGLLPPSGLLSIRRSLAAGDEAATAAIVGTESWRLDNAKDLIAAGVGTVASWSIPDAFEPISGGIVKTYSRGRKALRTVLEQPTVEGYHEWRKRTKYLWYQIRLIQRSAPSILQPLRSRLHDLSDALGDAHDLVVMADLIDSRGDAVEEDEREAFRVIAAGRRQDLEDRAISLGVRLFVETPKHFTRRLEGYWNAWQDCPERPAGDIEDLFSVEDDLEDRSVRELRDLAKQLDLHGRSTMRRKDLLASLRAAPHPRP